MRLTKYRLGRLYGKTFHLAYDFLLYEGIPGWLYAVNPGPYRLGAVEQRPAQRFRQRHGDE